MFKNSRATRHYVLSAWWAREFNAEDREWLIAIGIDPFHEAIG